MKHRIKLYLVNNGVEDLQETWTLTDDYMADAVSTILNGLEFAEEKLDQYDGPADEDETVPF